MGNRETIGGYVLPNLATGNFEILDGNNRVCGYLEPDAGGGFTFEPQPEVARRALRPSPGGARIGGQDATSNNISYLR